MTVLTNDEKQGLIGVALEARRRAYAPYSHYAVGAALRTKSGKIFTGCNVENAAYPVCMCAERVAIFKAISEGEKDFDVMVVATSNGGAPCGSCRQVMAEFSPGMTVLTCDMGGKVFLETTAAGLLPGAFTPGDLVP